MTANGQGARGTRPRASAATSGAAATRIGPARRGRLAWRQGAAGPGRAGLRAGLRAALALCAWAVPAGMGAIPLGTAPAVAAQEAPSSFTFRRIGVPRAGSTGRITVQIDPTAPRRAPAPPSPAREGAAARGAAIAGGGAPAASAAGVEWFWAGVSPLLADSGPGRLAHAIEVMAEAPEGEAIAGPRLQALQDIAGAYGRDILRETVGTRVSPALVLAMISVESAGQLDAVSSAGAAGLMQLMPATAARFGVSDRLAPSESIRGGVAYLDWLLAHFGGDPILAIAAYNAGEGAVRDSGGVPPYAETRAYVPKVLAAWQVARGLCQTPPELVSDGCVFAGGGI